MGIKNILIIEDDTAICDAMTELLIFEGFNVSAVHHGREAMDYLKKEALIIPDLIILDLMMPVMDGFQFLEEQKSLPQISNIPIYVMSANGRFHDTEKLGVAGFFRKPLDVDQLLKVLHSNI